MSNLHRIFIAVNLSKGIKSELFEKLGGKIDKKKCKLVEMANLHVTMKFLGYLNQQNLQDVKNKIEELESFGKFNMTLKSVGEFGGRVIWLGVEKGSEELRQISGKLDELLGIKDERFHPHVTLARNKELLHKDVKELVERLNKVGFEKEVFVESVDLMESVLSQEGPTYKVLKKVSLL